MSDILRLQFIDYSGHQSWLGLYVASAATEGQIEDLIAAAQAMSSCLVNQATLEKVIYGPLADVGDTGSYATHRDVATMVLRGTGSLRDTIVRLPGPLSGCFDTDTETLVPTATIVQPFLEALAAIGLDKDGLSLTYLVRGYRDYVPR